MDSGVVARVEWRDDGRNRRPATVRERPPARDVRRTHVHLYGTRLAVHRLVLARVHPPLIGAFAAALAQSFLDHTQARLITGRRCNHCPQTLILFLLTLEPYPVATLNLHDVYMYV